MTQGRILSIDYGDRRIGLAVSDPLGITAQGLDTLVVNSRKDAMRRIFQVIATWEATTILLGMPLNMDGTRGQRAEEVVVLAERLRSDTGLPVILWDERLTSQAAIRTLHRLGVKLKGRKRDVDRIAATMMLQEYLESVSGTGQSKTEASEHA